MSNPFAGAIASMTTFDRRASRTEYAIGMIAIGAVYYIAAAVAVGITLLTKNRFNDFGASGWWQILPLTSFIALFIVGDDGPNKYGVRT